MSDLSDIVVVAIEQAVAAPYCSMQLADAGARVIKIERPEGDFARHYDTLVKGQSAYFVWLNRGKESLCLDLREEGDRVLLRRIVARADVVIQNLKPGTMAKLGLAMDDLLASDPRLIGCSISGFGETGPLAQHKAYDLIVQAETGLCSITGTHGEPARVGVSVCDIAAGMTAHAAILQALYAREKTGIGRKIEVSLFDALADWMNVPLLQKVYGGFETRRSGVNHPSLSPYGAYATSGGAKVIFSVQNQREWRAFCERVIGDAELADRAGLASNMERLENRAALDQIVADRFAALSLDEALTLLEDSGIAHGRLNTIDQLAEHPHLRRISVATEAGEVHVIAPGAQARGAGPPRPMVPAHGQHSAALRAEFAA